MKATNLKDFNSSPAPKAWEEMPNIKAQRPKSLNCALQKLSGLNLCVWMVSDGVYWKVASDYFHVR